MYTALGFFLAILTIIISEHFKKYFRIVNSLANLKFYLNIYNVNSKRVIEVHNKAIEEKKDYIMHFTYSDINKYFKDDIVAILLVKNKILTNAVLKAVNRIEEFNTLIKNKNQYCIFSMTSKQEDVREYNTNHLVYKSLLDKIPEYKVDLPNLIKDALNSLNELSKFNFVMRYVQIMWKKSEPEFGN